MLFHMTGDGRIIYWGGIVYCDADDRAEYSYFVHGRPYVVMVYTGDPLIVVCPD